MGAASKSEDFTNFDSLAVAGLPGYLFFNLQSIVCGHFDCCTFCLWHVLLQMGAGSSTYGDAEGGSQPVTDGKASGADDSGCKQAVVKQDSIHCFTQAHPHQAI